MDAPPARMRVLAEKLLAAEAADRSQTHPNIQDALRVFDKLRISLTRFAGAEGFSALTRRALALARTDEPLLDSVTVEKDGTIAGFEEVLARADDGGKAAALALTVRLLSLLVTFIGESLTLRLIRDSWPDESLDN